MEDHQPVQDSLKNMQPVQEGLNSLVSHLAPDDGHLLHIWLKLSGTLFFMKIENLPIDNQADLDLVVNN